ncbi:MAG: ABC transporter permease subunit [Sphingomonadaceae bacterium]|nr:ABC transporter permease subunit [Sphingomonadaceae bacterium]
MHPSSLLYILTATAGLYTHYAYPVVLIAVNLAALLYFVRHSSLAIRHSPFATRHSLFTGWLLLLAFGRNGPIGAWLEDWFGVTVMFRWTGAAIAAAVMALPLMVRALRLSIEAVDRGLESAARTLGAGRTRVFLSVTLPLSAPGVLVACVLGFARSIGEFGATITFVSNVPGETQTVPLAIYSALQLPGGETQVLRLAVIAIVLSLAALVASEILARRAARGRHVL